MPEVMNHDDGQSHETRVTVKYEGIPKNLNEPSQLPKWINFILWLTEKAKEYGVALSLAVKAPDRFLEAKLQEAEKPAYENKKVQAESSKIAEETAIMAMERQAKFAIHQQELAEKKRQANLEAMQKISDLLSNPSEDIGILESKFEILEEAYPHIRAQIEKIKDRHIKLLVKGVKIEMTNTTPYLTQFQSVGGGGVGGLEDKVTTVPNKHTYENLRDHVLLPLDGKNLQK